MATELDPSRFVGKLVTYTTETAAAHSEWGQCGLLSSPRPTLETWLKSIHNAKYSDAPLEDSSLLSTEPPNSYEYIFSAAGSPTGVKLSALSAVPTFATASACSGKNLPESLRGDYAMRFTYDGNSKSPDNYVAADCPAALPPGPRTIAVQLTADEVTALKSAGVLTLRIENLVSPQLRRVSLDSVTYDQYSELDDTKYAYSAAYSVGDLVDLHWCASVSAGYSNTLLSAEFVQIAASGDVVIPVDATALATAVAGQPMVDGTVWINISIFVAWTDGTKWVQVNDRGEKTESYVDTSGTANLGYDGCCVSHYLDSWGIAAGRIQEWKISGGSI